MRLTKEEIKAIKETAIEVFGEGVEVWIFGSRVDDSKKGGDIDIYIETNNYQNVVEKKIKFLVKLKDTIGDQKIDAVIKRKNCQEFICREAKSKGVKI